MKGLVIRMDITTIFTTILNMSVTATYCIAAVILLRLLLSEYSNASEPPFYRLRAI